MIGNSLNHLSADRSACGGRGVRSGLPVRNAILPVLLMLVGWAAATGVAAENSPGEPLRIVYFYSPTCGECHNVAKALPAILKPWGGRVSLEKRNIEDVEAFNELFLYEEHYGAEVYAPPVIFIGSQCIIGEKLIKGRLGEVIGEELSSHSLTFAPLAPADEASKGDSADRAQQEVLNRFSSFGVWAVAIAGLVDGVNPCAFTTIIFLLSMLAYLGKSKRDLAVVGVGFTVSIFVTYFLLGMGLMGAIKTFSVSSGISSALSVTVGLLTLALAGWSLWDFIQYTRTRDIKKVTLGLPKAIKARIHKVIRTGLTTRGLAVGSIGIGFVVAILESLCTGQVYLPTIVFVARSPGMRGDAIAYLLLYNLMFIIPLVGILVVAYMGVRSERLGDFFRRRLGLFKLAMAVIFAGLATLLLLPQIASAG